MGVGERYLVFCPACEGNGCVEDEGGVLWVCPECNGTGEKVDNHV